MFCNQCEQTRKGVSCTTDTGVCGKTEAAAHLQDALLAGCRLYARALISADAAGKMTAEDGDVLFSSLFSTLTNVDFDPASLKAKLVCLMKARETLLQKAGLSSGERSAGSLADELVLTAPSPDAFAEDENVRSAMQIIAFGVKGTAAYAHHAAELGKRDRAMVLSCAKLLAAEASDERDLSGWLELALACGRANLAAMQLLDEGNTESFGDPVPTEVITGHRQGHAILVSGHDLKDLLEILKATEGKGVDVYSHGEMLPAHGYPELHKFSHFAGHFGTAWCNQASELRFFPGPVIFTTNCIQNPKNRLDQVFTANVVSWPGCTHIENGDYSAVIAKALEMPGFTDAEEGRTVLTGFGRKTLLSAAPALLEAVKTGTLRHVFLVGGCDGIRKEREYFSEFVEKTPADTVILTLGCAKFRFFDKALGSIGALPRLIDAGQCNDAYAAVTLALNLAETLGVSVNELPLSLVLSWYEQKAVSVLLTLLALGVKNIRLGPSLPAFVSPDILKALVDGWNIAPVKDPDSDLRAILG